MSRTRRASRNVPWTASTRATASLYIHPDECVDCGACEPVCPVEAIYYEDDVPDKWAEYYNANVEFFTEIGSPGGAAKMGLIEHDHDIIKALPLQARRVGHGAAARLPCPTFHGTRSTPSSAARSPYIRTGSSTSPSAPPSTPRRP